MLRHVRLMSLKLRVMLLVTALIVVGIWGLALRVAAVLQDDLEQDVAAHLSAMVPATSVPTSDNNCSSSAIDD